MGNENNIQQLLQQELEAVNTILDQGVPFTVPKKSLFRHLPGRSVRTFKMRKLYLGTMDLLAEITLKIVINQSRLEANPINEVNNIIKANSYFLAQAGAICILNSRWKIFLFKRLFASYLIWHLNAEKMNELSGLIEKVQDAGNFINSTGLLSGIIRTSQPKPDPLEESQKEQ